jgi:hypothetical protein
MLSTRILLAAVALAASSSFLPAQWLQTSPTTPPTQRRAGAMAFDATTNRLVANGGLTQTPSTILDETWSYNGQWTQLTPAGAPPARWGHQLVRNPNNNRLITFGGRSPSITTYANDTWEYTGTVWLQVPTPTAPSARYHYGLAYDTVRNVAVLFGGHDAQGLLADTWEFDGVTWTQRTLANAPAAREEQTMIFDASLNRVVLFGGVDSDTNTLFGDTWTYDGVNWLNSTPSVSPSPRYRAAMAYDTVRQRTVLFGGFDGSDIVTDTYEYTGSEWSTVAPQGSGPANATEVYSGYDPVRRKFVVFGGFGGTFSNDTWEFTGATAGLFGTFGSACSTTAQLPSIAGTVPTIGQTLTISFGDIGLDVETVVVVFGFSNQSWMGMPLPFDLAPLNLAGCNLYVSADVAEIVLTTGGTASYQLPIPNQVQLVNSVVFVQGLPLDINPNDFAFVGATRGGRAVIGN